jgi:hypothetical protein
MSRILFIRHGNCWGSSGLSELGKQDISRVLVKLKDLGFSPKIPITTRAQRCIETAQILVPDAEPIICAELPCYCVWRDQRKKGDEMLKSIEPYLQKDKDAIVVCHDAMPAIMAFRLMEMRGGSVSWDCLPESATCPGMGCGILLDGISFVSIYP